MPFFDEIKASDMSFDSRISKIWQTFNFVLMINNNNSNNINNTNNATIFQLKFYF